MQEVTWIWPGNDDWYESSMALERASGAEIHRPLAVVYIGGFIIAIVFEQIILPILYEIFAPREEAQAIVES